MSKNLGDKTPKDSYKDLLQLGSENAGFDGGNWTLRDGAGVAGPIAIGKNIFYIAPATTDGLLFRVAAKNGNTLLRIDSNTEYIRVTDNLHHVTTLEDTFYTKQLSPASTGHFPLSRIQTSTEVNLTDFGTGTDPSNTLDFSAAGDANSRSDLMLCMKYLPEAIKVDKVDIMVMTDNAATDTCEFHLMDYAISATGSTHGDLSDSNVLAYTGSLNVDNTGPTFVEATLGGTTTAVAGRVMMAFIKATSNTGDFAAQLRVKYHLI